MTRYLPLDLSLLVVHYAVARLKLQLRFYVPHIERARTYRITRQQSDAYNCSCRRMMVSHVHRCSDAHGARCNVTVCATDYLVARLDKKISPRDLIPTYRKRILSSFARRAASIRTIINSFFFFHNFSILNSSS